jgi:hypothetical protein
VPREPDDISGVGLYASFIDTEGNRLSMLEPVPMQFGGIKLRRNDYEKTYCKHIYNA